MKIFKFSLTHVFSERGAQSSEFDTWIFYLNKLGAQYNLFLTIFFKEMLSLGKID